MGHYFFLHCCTDFSDNTFFHTCHAMGTFNYTTVYRVKVKFDGFDQCTCTLMIISRIIFQVLKKMQFLHATIATCLFMEGNVGSLKKIKKNNEYDLDPYLSKWDNEITFFVIWTSTISFQVVFNSKQSLVGWKRVTILHVHLERAHQSTKMTFLN